MWQWVAESRKSIMLPISKTELSYMLNRSLDIVMNENIQIISEHDSFSDVNEFSSDLYFDEFLSSRWEVHDLILLMDFTGNLDAPLP